MAVSHASPLMQKPACSHRDLTTPRPTRAEAARGEGAPARAGAAGTGLQARPGPAPRDLSPRGGRWALVSSAEGHVAAGTAPRATGARAALHARELGGSRPPEARVRLTGRTPDSHVHPYRSDARGARGRRCPLPGDAWTGPPWRSPRPPPPPPPPHSRECSSSRAALAARSRPVGSKLLHLSLGPGRSPAPRSPPPSAPGCTGGRGSGGPSPSPLGPLMPKSQDMARERRVPPPPDLDRADARARLLVASTRWEPTVRATAQARRTPTPPRATEAPEDLDRAALGLAARIVTSSALATGLPELALGRDD